EVSMPWNWPVETNYHEAKAFCNWKAKTTGQPVRLPTEDEWYRLYEAAGLTEIAHDAPAKGNPHLDFYASSCPVDEFRQGGFYDIVGNVWQWTETPMYPFSGFDVHPLYDDFTTPTFDDQHNLIKGGSWVSCGNETLRSSRYAFRRHFFSTRVFAMSFPMRQLRYRHQTTKPTNCYRNTLNFIMVIPILTYPISPGRLLKSQSKLWVTGQPRKRWIWGARRDALPLSLHVISIT